MPDARGRAAGDAFYTLFPHATWGILHGFLGGDMRVRRALPLGALVVLTCSAASRGAEESRLLAHSPTLSKTQDRKSTRLNSSHGYISYAVFCLKKKKHTTQPAALPATHPCHRRRVRMCLCSSLFVLWLAPTTIPHSSARLTMAGRSLTGTATCY